MKGTKTVRVAAAIICSEGKIYATQRGYGPFKDGWEFPGGKLEKGESSADAVRREIREELDTVIHPEKLFYTVEYDYPEFHLSMDCFLCTVVEGELVLREHESARWLSRGELDEVEWLPADHALIADLKERWQEITEI